MMSVTFVEDQIETKTRGEHVPANSTHVLLLRNRIQFHKKVNWLFAVNTKNS